MIDLGLFGDRTFRRGAIVATYLAAATTGVIFVLPQYLEVVQGNTVMGAGLRMLPMVGGLVLANLLSERLPRRFGFRPTVIAGLLILAAGYGLGASTSATSHNWFIQI